jgi:hypothetical protein
MPSDMSDCWLLDQFRLKSFGKTPLANVHAHLAMTGTAAKADISCNLTIFELWNQLRSCQCVYVLARAKDIPLPTCTGWSLVVKVRSVIPPLAICWHWTAHRMALWIPFRLPGDISGKTKSLQPLQAGDRLKSRQLPNFHPGFRLDIHIIAWLDIESFIKCRNVG